MSNITPADLADAMATAFDVAMQKRGAYISVMEKIDLDGSAYDRHTNFSVVIDSRTGESHPYGVYVYDKTNTRWFRTKADAIALARGE
jgi:hypothetical protein